MSSCNCGWAKGDGEVATFKAASGFVRLVPTFDIWAKRGGETVFGVPNAGGFGPPALKPKDVVEIVSWFGEPRREEVANPPNVVGSCPSVLKTENLVGVTSCPARLPLGSSGDVSIVVLFWRLPNRPNWPPGMLVGLVVIDAPWPVPSIVRRLPSTP